MLFVLLAKRKENALIVICSSGEKKDTGKTNGEKMDVLFHFISLPSFLIILVLDSPSIRIFCLTFVQVSRLAVAFGRSRSQKRC
jgi:hypothetical protein